MGDFKRGTERAATLCDRRADALATKLGRGPMLDEVTKGIIEILRDTASQIRNMTDRGAA